MEQLSVGSDPVEGFSYFGKDTRSKLKYSSNESTWIGLFDLSGN